MVDNDGALKINDYTKMIFWFEWYTKKGLKETFKYLLESNKTFL